MKSQEPVRLTKLEQENRRLKELVAEKELDTATPICFLREKPRTPHN